MKKSSQKLLDAISERYGSDLLYPTDMADAIIGIVERFGMEPLILLDRTKCIKLLEKQGMTWEEAEEFFEFNVIGAWMGDKTPCFAILKKDFME